MERCVLRNKKYEGFNEIEFNDQNGYGVKMVEMSKSMIEIV